MSAATLLASLGDNTSTSTEAGWQYLAAVMHLFSRKIVRWAIRDHLPTELAASALAMASQRQQPSRPDWSIIPIVASHDCCDGLSGTSVAASTRPTATIDGVPYLKHRARSSSTAAEGYFRLPIQSNPDSSGARTMEELPAAPFLKQKPKSNESALAGQYRKKKQVKKYRHHSVRGTV
jgi:hypothetical protein